MAMTQTQTEGLRVQVQAALLKSWYDARLPVPDLDGWNRLVDAVTAAAANGQDRLHVQLHTTKGN